MRMRGLVVVTLIIFIQEFASEALAYKEITHQAITGKASVASRVEKDLQSKLQLDRASIDRALALIRQGSVDEDRPFTRSRHHFHTATKSNPWGDAGLTDGIDLFGVSSLIWGTSGSGSFGLFNNEFSWQKAREYYFQFLTAASETKRNEMFNKTFESIGHVVHLIQDAAQPAHTRNDNHTFNDPYEDNFMVSTKGWLIVNGSFAAPLDYKLLPHFYPLAASGGYNALTDFWDTDGVYPFRGRVPGIAEYSNANFLSRDTMFTTDPKHDFPHPSIFELTSTDFNVALPQVIIAEDNKTDRVIYARRTTSDGIVIRRFVKARYFAREMQMRLPQREYVFTSWDLDDNCFAEYAAVLIPRAISYSAAMIDYFFRADMEVTVADTLADSSGNIVGLKVMVKNTTSGEDMSGGNLVLVASFKSAGAFRAAVSSPLSAAIPFNNSPEAAQFTFHFTSPVPSGAEDLRYILVYRGRLGSEADAVAAKVIPMDVLFYSAYARATWDIYVLTGSSSRKIGSIPCCDAHDMAVSPDGSKVYAFNGLTVYSVDVATGSTAPIASLAAFPSDRNFLTGISVSPDGSTLYATKYYGYDTYGEQGTIIFAISVDSGKVLAAYTATCRKESEDELGCSPMTAVKGSTLSPDGFNLYLVGTDSWDERPDEIYSFSGGSPVKLFTLPDQWASLQVDMASSPDGRSIYIQTCDFNKSPCENQIARFDLGSNAFSIIYRSGVGIGGIAVDKTGKNLLFSEGLSIKKMSLETGAISTVATIDAGVPASLSIPLKR